MAYDENGQIPTMEVFRYLTVFRCVSVDTLQMVHAFLLHEEGMDFSRLLRLYVAGTERLRFGTEDILSHFNYECYRPATSIPHIDNLRMEFGLGFPQTVRRYFRFFTLVPSCLVPPFALEVLEEQHLNPCGALYMRFPLISQFAWPLYGDTPDIWPPRPLETLGWASSRHIMVVGPFSTRYRHLLLPGNRYVDSTGRTVVRYRLLDGSLLT